MCSNKACGRECSCQKKSHKNNCIEEPVLNEIYQYFDLLEKRDLSETLRKIHKNTNDNEGKQIRELEKNIKEYSNKNDLLKEEIMNVITGKSTFTRELISELMEENKQKIENFQKQKIRLEHLKKQKEVDFEQMLKMKSMIPDWKEVLKNASCERKKMILSAMIKEIVVYDHKIDIHLRISFNEFLRTAQKLGSGKNSKFAKNLCNTRTN